MIRVTSFGAHANEWRDQYIRKIQRMTPFEWIEIPLKKIPNTRPSQLLIEERRFLNDHAEFVLLDPLGKEINSTDFQVWCFKASRHLVVGPSIGFHPEFRERALSSVSLSKLTFTHGLAQVMLAESIYRSICIVKNHPFVK